MTTNEEEGKIKQGTIAQFMRKRTQLVGFEFGYWKHTQYAAEFLDNALDAIEDFQWRELQKEDSKYKFSLDRELSLENLSIINSEIESESESEIDDESKHALMQEVGLEPAEGEEEVKEIKTEEGDIIIDKDEIEIEEEVKKIISEMDSIVRPVETIIDQEPIVIVRLREYEPPSFLTAELSQKNVMLYTFEIFDNGTGMAPTDMRKYGKYLASSKSMELKQTRGSQGFGAPSAFSDAQNTTGRPVVVVSKNSDTIYATVSEFFTTSKNEKKYIIKPTEIDSPFLHGTYIKLNYLNIKYNRGYVDSYIESTALMNSFVTLVFIDPYGEEHIYPRKVSTFPEEPKYAKPHPSSTNIGDLQDLLGKSENLTISAFLQDNFVRVSNRVAKEVLDLAERDLQDKLNLLILKKGFINIIQKKSDKVYFSRMEKRIYGRSKKKRPKLIVYEIDESEMRDKYNEIITKYNNHNKQIGKIEKNIKKKYGEIDEAEYKKDKRAIKKEIRKLRKEIDSIRDDKDKLRDQLSEIFNDNIQGLNEVKNDKKIRDMEDLVEEVQISDARPNELTTDQFNSLFLAFKSVKYMSPPTDTAIPVGDTVLENTLIKELGLKVSDNLDDFDNPIHELKTSKDTLLKRKRNYVIKEDPAADEEVLKHVSVDSEEIVDLNSQILYSFIEEKEEEPEEITESSRSLIKSGDSGAEYKDLFDYFLENFTLDDDFVAAETRDPTSGKGLAYVVEAVMAYSKNLETPKRSRDVLYRFVNRTPKLRDSADCAITKAVQKVNWKNYKLESYDNGLPKGPIKVLVNVSGPFVHLMFKSQSKNSLSEDENLIKEIKYCLEAIGRRLRVYLNRRANIRKREKRANLIDKYIPVFAKSVYKIASEGETKHKDITEKDLVNSMRSAIGRVPAPSGEEKPQVEPVASIEIPESEEKEVKKEVKPKKKEEEKPSEEKKVGEKVEEKKEEKPSIEKKEEYDIDTLEAWTVKKLKAFAEENNINIPSRARKTDIVDKIHKSISKEELAPKRKEVKERKEEKAKKKEEKPTKAPSPEKIRAAKARMKGKTTPSSTPKKKPMKPKTSIKPKATTQTTLPVITTDRVLDALSDEWQTIKHLIFQLRIKDMMDARFLQIKLKELERKDKVLVDIKKGKKHWKLKK